jgi:hypothetical protein
MESLMTRLPFQRLPAGRPESPAEAPPAIFRRFAAGMGLGAAISGALCHADTGGAPYDSFEDFLAQTRFHGNLRSYFFARDYSHDAVVDQHAFSLGGYAGLLTAPVYNVQAGLTLGTANSLGLNPVNTSQVDTTLPGNTVYVLTEAFVQYKHKYFTVRGPDQILDTPWISPSDSRMKPSGYRAVYGELTPFADYAPLKDLTFIGLRLFAFNGRAEGTFNTTNLYFPDHAGGSPVSELAGKSAPGALAFALKYGGTPGNPLTAQRWYNKFYNFSQLLLFDGNYIHKTGTGFDPLIGFQFRGQWGDGDNLLEQVGKGAAGNTQAYGVIAGIDTPYVRLTAAYNGITKQNGAFANGDLLSPYSTGYSTDPLYTTQMIGGMIEKQSPGSAFRVAATSYFMDKQVKALVSYGSYYITPTSSYTSNPYETNIDITYSFPKSSNFDGLSIRNRFGWMAGNIKDGDFYYERFQVQYQF